MFSPHSATRRKLLLGLLGIAVCLYALAVLWYVQAIPDIGLRCAFDTQVKYIYQPFLRAEGNAGPSPEVGDTIVQLGDRVIRTWPELLRAQVELRSCVPTSVGSLPEADAQGLAFVSFGNEKLVRVQFSRPTDPSQNANHFTCWCLVGPLPLEELFPSVAWFFLKVGLFLVGALVFWKRPTDASATLFFLLCIATLGAYMGGYHWSRIATQPLLLLVFMVCAVLLPVVLLHFYFVFPRPKVCLLSHPRLTLLAIYGLPAVFLVAMAGTYLLVLLLARRYLAGNVDRVLDLLLAEILSYLAVAGLWYLGSVVCLVHSYRSALDATERNQVKWILFASLIALVPIGYSLYLAGWERNDFATGAATWPMFLVSVCFTVAFAISITRYRLMQLDQLIGSGMVYFLISFLAALIFYGVVFAGTLLVGNRVIPWPRLPQALAVSTTALVLMLVLDLARSRIRRALDRRYFRHKHQLDRTLRRMGEAIEQLVDPPTLARRLLQASADLLNVSRAAVYLREGEPPVFRLAGSLGPAPLLSELPANSPLLEALPPEGALLASSSPADPKSAAERQLRLLGGEVAQPLAHEGHLLALLVLGPKDLGWYGTDDLNLLAAFAQLTTLALESAERRRTIETLSDDLKTKIEKISEQQRRILSLQSQLNQRSAEAPAVGGTREAGSRAATANDGRASDHGIDLAASSGIIGSGAAVRDMGQLARKAAASQAAVLIRGESGTGKELLARALHENSSRAGKAFVKVHCAALSPNLLESELFGHVKGAFTGAHRDKVGRFEMANGGTLFLDEIGDISLEIQTKLLRVLQEKTFERVGSSMPVAVDVRIITATHQNLEQLIRQGRFREDLYYRLNVVSIVAPPLRERREDIPELALHFLRVYAERSGKPVPQLDDDTLVALKAYAWPGNIRELENVLERALVISDAHMITPRDLPDELLRPAVARGEPADTREPLRIDGDGIDRERVAQEEREQRERERLVRALAATRGNKAEAARSLGLARSTLLSRLKKYGLS